MKEFWIGITLAVILGTLAHFAKSISTEINQCGLKSVIMQLWNGPTQKKE